VAPLPGTATQRRGYNIVTPVGLAPRFPRIKAIRRDKDVGSVDTFQYARDLAEQPANLPINFDQARN